MWTAIVVLSLAVALLLVICLKLARAFWGVEADVRVLRETIRKRVEVGNAKWAALRTSIAAVDSARLSDREGNAAALARLENRMATRFGEAMDEISDIAVESGMEWYEPEIEETQPRWRKMKKGGK